MEQLPIFTNLLGRNVVLMGGGDAADAKRRLIERAGGICVADCPNVICRCARIAFVALDDAAQAIAAADRLRAKGMLVNVVDRPDYCDFTTPAIVDRNPVLIAIGTGGASAGMAKALRQRIESMLPQSLGTLANLVSSARGAIHARWPEPAARRRALDAAFQTGGALDPLRESAPDTLQHWIATGDNMGQSARLVTIQLLSNDPEDLTLRTARLLGEADQIYYDAGVADKILQRARADAVRIPGAPPAIEPEGLSLYLRL